MHLFPLGTLWEKGQEGVAVRAAEQIPINLQTWESPDVCCSLITGTPSHQRESRSDHYRASQSHVSALCPHGVGDSGSTGSEHAGCSESMDSMVNGLPLTFCRLVPGHLNLYVFRNYKGSEFFL